MDWTTAALIVLVTAVVILVGWAIRRGRDVEVTTALGGFKVGGPKDARPDAKGDLAPLAATPKHPADIVVPDEIDTPQIAWDHELAAIKKVSDQVKAFDPDVIVGLNDGIVVAAILAINLPAKASSHRPCYSLGVAITDSVAHPGVREMRLTGTDLIPDLSHKRVLLVDDHIYTGISLGHAVRCVREHGATELRTLVLFESSLENKVFSPDITAFRMSGKRKKVPWSYTSDHFRNYST